MNVLDDEGFNPARAHLVHIHPDDGMVYTPIELEAIMELAPPPLEDLALSRENIFAFHERARVYGMSKRLIDHVGDIDDARAVDILLRDTLAQDADPIPAGLHEGCSLDCQLDHRPLENGD